MELMQSIRDSIKNDRFPEFVRAFLQKRYTEADQSMPEWIIEALASVGIFLPSSPPHVNPVAETVREEPAEKRKRSFEEDSQWTTEV